MKKSALFLFIAAMFILLYRPVKAQTFKPGDNVFNLGIGVLGDYYSGVGYTTSLPPISLSYEHGLNIKNFGLGAILAFSSSSYNYGYTGYNYYYRYTHTILGLRAAYHFYTQHKFDIYGGAVLGYDIVSYTTNYTYGYGGYTATGSGLAFDLFVGGRYYFTDHFGVMAELGFGIAILNIGVALKL